MNMVYESPVLTCENMDHYNCSSPDFYLLSQNAKWKICCNAAEEVFGKIKRGKKYRLCVSKKKKSGYKKLRIRLDRNGDFEVKVKGGWEWEYIEEMPNHLLQIFGKCKKVWVKLIKAKQS